MTLFINKKILKIYIIISYLTINLIILNINILNLAIVLRILNKYNSTLIIINDNYYLEYF